MRLRRAVLALVAIFTAVTAMSRGASAESGAAGGAGTDTSLPATDSAVTVAGRGRFSDMRVSVNQTKGLANQAVSVTWTGARPSIGFGSNVVQIFQCWGDEDGSNPDNPGPPPEQCEQGGQPFAGSVTSRIPFGASPSNTYTRAIANDNWSTFDAETAAPRDPSHGHLAPDHDAATGKLWLPFRAVDGTVISRQLIVAGDSNTGFLEQWQNPYFDFVKTNEDNWQKTYGDGTGAAVFQVFTGFEAAGLGCGQSMEPQADGTKRIPKCWLVVVPRGTPEEENPSNVSGQPYVVTSPLTSTAWQNRIAFPLEFNPLDSSCAIGRDQRNIVGGEIASRAAVNWQPTLCAGDGATPFAYKAIGETQARRQITSAAPGAAGMAIVTRPIASTDVDPDAPITYAPISLSGAVVGFNVERVPNDYDGVVRDEGEPALAGIRVAHMNLTPRLVAKLLTQSYPKQFPLLVASKPPAGYEWIEHNAEHLFRDQDFLRFNPEFAVMSVGSQQAAGGLVVEGAISDTATEVWRWLFADPEAKAWLDGAPDEWGTRVNPLFSTSSAVNPSGVGFGESIPDTFPRNDPYCYEAAADNGITPRPLCMLDAGPLALNMEIAAQSARAANDRRTTSHDVQNPTQQTAETYWGADGPQLAGARSILSLTDAASAARYGLQTASLSRSGDDGDTRRFVAPETAGLLEGVKAMRPVPDTDVLVPDPTAAVAGAYPLSLLAYAAVAPANLDDAGRSDYARYVTYAAGPGQTPGFKFGDLPAGYAPLPDALREQAKTAAAAILAGAKPAVAADDEEAAEAAEEPAADEADRSMFDDDRPLESLTMADLIQEITNPAPAAAAKSPAVTFISPLRALGKTPQYIVGALRFAVPFAFVLGGLALLLFLLFDTARLRVLVTRRER